MATDPDPLADYNRKRVTNTPSADWYARLGHEAEGADD